MIPWVRTGGVLKRRWVREGERWVARGARVGATGCGPWCELGTPGATGRCEHACRGDPCARVRASSGDRGPAPTALRGWSPVPMSCDVWAAERRRLRRCQLIRKEEQPIDLHK